MGFAKSVMLVTHVHYIATGIHIQETPFWNWIGYNTFIAKGQTDLLYDAIHTYDGHSISFDI